MNSNKAHGYEQEDILVLDVAELEATMRPTPVSNRLNMNLYNNQLPAVLPKPKKPAMESLGDARIGLGLFIDEAEQALASRDLTIDQRLHVATILSYVEGLAKRLDVVRQPGFVQPPKASKR